MLQQLQLLLSTLLPQVLLPPPTRPLTTRPPIAALRCAAAFKPYTYNLAKALRHIDPLALATPVGLVVPLELHLVALDYA